DSVEKWGQFGDYIGGVLNPALAFISIMLVCFTLYSTSRQSSIQSFESVLFELLRFHKDNLSEIKTTYSDGKMYVGREALSLYITEVKFNLLNIVDDSLPLDERLELSVNMVYLEGDNFANVGHYFRNIYHIFKHINDSNYLTEKEKTKYAKLVRAQISSIESGAMLLNGFSSVGKPAKKFIEKYSLLQGFSLSKEFKQQLHDLGALKLYDDVAYEDKKGH
ncbi:TPA: putative phage abortive infection protein, partial [Klebsiella pneumoniae]|nr:putative phage abortive infection protein [Klebsiella pneumoniae]